VTWHAITHLSIKEYVGGLEVVVNAGLSALGGLGRADVAQPGHDLQQYRARVLRRSSNSGSTPRHTSMMLGGKEVETLR
jgi:hypothetical protein